MVSILIEKLRTKTSHRMAGFDCSSARMLKIERKGDWQVDLGLSSPKKKLKTRGLRARWLDHWKASQTGWKIAHNLRLDQGLHKKQNSLTDCDFITWHEWHSHGPPGAESSRWKIQRFFAMWYWISGVPNVFVSDFLDGNPARSKRSPSSLAHSFVVHHDQSLSVTWKMLKLWGMAAKIEKSRLKTPYLFCEWPMACTLTQNLFTVVSFVVTNLASQYQAHNPQNQWSVPDLCKVASCSELSTMESETSRILATKSWDCPLTPFTSKLKWLAWVWASAE